MTATAAPRDFLTWSQSDDAWEGQLRALSPYVEELWNRVQMVQDMPERPRVCAVAGVLQGDGASTIAAALAHYLARGPGLRTILVETDLRGPVMRDMQLCPRTPGLVGLLGRRAHLHHVVFDLPEVGFHVLPAGGTPESPSSKLQPAQLRELLHRLSGHFEVVVLDVPPLSLAPEARHVIAQADATIAVLRSGRSLPEQAAYWLGKIGEYGGRIGAVCFNDVESPLPTALRKLL